MKLIIHYFSGTGNALHVAHWIRDIAKQKNMDVTLIDISKEKIASNTEKESLIGFISPTHGFNFPPLMFHYLLRFPKGKGQKVFIINTRGGLKLSKYFIPGLSGMAQYFSAFILALKGYKIIGMHPIDLPSNWISIHPGLKKNVIDSIYKKRKTEAEVFAQKIISGKKDLKALRDIIQDLFITPIGILYYLIGRFVLAKTFIASNRCNGCNLCINECPVKAIKLIGNRPFWTYKCESCMHCMNACPQRAIETAHGFITLIIIFVNLVVLAQFNRLFEAHQFIHSILPKYIAGIGIIIFESAIFLGVLFVSYKLSHFLLRFSFFEKLIVYTSLTKYRFWRRYKIKRPTPNSDDLMKFYSKN